MIRLSGTHFGLAKQYTENAHALWMEIINKNEVSEKKESLNEFTNRWKTCRIKDTSQYPDI